MSSTRIRLAFSALVVLLMAGTFTAHGQAPTITSFSPTSGPVGTSVVIKGSNFKPPFSVAFAGGASAAGSFSSTQITVTVPQGAQTGVITVTTSAGSAMTATEFTVTDSRAPVVAGGSASSTLGQSFSYSIAATNSPMSYDATGLPTGLSVNKNTGAISGAPSAPGSFSVSLSAMNSFGTGTATLALTVLPLPFFSGEASLGSGVYYLGFPNGNNFGEYSYLSDARYIYSYDLSGYEFLTDANDGKAGIYLYDSKSGTFFYTSPTFSYPYLYDFTLKAVLYYYQGSANPRYFYNFGSGKIITK